MSLEATIKTQWSHWNKEGVILYQSDTLTTKTIQHGGIGIHLIHNARRDVYDRSPKDIDKSSLGKKKFADGSNPELAQTEDGYFNVLGNRFACMEYQSVLVPVVPVMKISVEFLEKSLRLASKYSQITLMYNALNAGKTVHNQYWLMSFHGYETLNQDANTTPILNTARSIRFSRQEVPCYMLSFQISEQVSDTAQLLFAMIDFMEHKNFNMFLYNNRVFFIPREDVEIPDGFENHRFGGLEMIGYFIMKSLEALQSAETQKLIEGIQQISYKPQSQQRFEAYLLKL